MREKTIAKKREKLAEFAAMMALGLTEDQIILEMGLNPSEFEALMERFYKEQEIRQVAKTALQTYLDYTNRQTQLIRDLEGLKLKLREKDKGKWGTGSGANAYVGAVKAQSEIYDKLISTGQTLDLIKAAPKRIEQIGGQSVRDMDPEELREAIRLEMKLAQKMVDKKRSRHAGKKVVALYPGNDDEDE